MSDKLRTGLEVFEDRHCGRAVPGIANEALPIPVPVPPSCRSLPIPTVVPTPPVSTEPLDSLISDDLLDRINKFALSQLPDGTVPAPACKKQGPYTYAGVTSQYPHVKAGTGR